ncbi:hypothetical protein [Bradyrhizobium genosp. P]|uniref:hypothetical protein n=1 Tax=Bradyrhizobium genosp. P TaxID=83641 RepID=UPI003CF133F3
MNKRKRIKQATSLSSRLFQLAIAAKAKASELPPGRDRELLLKKAREAERAVQIEQLLTTPGQDLPY